MRTVIVIPARMGSTRLPNKPLIPIAGHPLLYRTWSLAKAVEHIDGVYIATDDAKIEQAARDFGAQVIMSLNPCEHGSQRVWDAVQQLKEQPEMIINLQGDALLTPPWVIQEVVDAMQRDASIDIATPAVLLTAKQYHHMVELKSAQQVSGTNVVFDLQKNALYFSRSIIPHQRNETNTAPPVYRHIGLYGYRYASLEAYSKLAPTPLEIAEKLEQLRALEHGMRIRIVVVDYQNRTHGSIDYPEDIAIAEAIIQAEGELVLTTHTYEQKIETID